jgi:hypothetical protein
MVASGVAAGWHAEQRQPYKNYGTLVRIAHGREKDPDLVEQINRRCKWDRV